MMEYGAKPHEFYGLSGMTTLPVLKWVTEGVRTCARVRERASPVSCPFIADARFRHLWWAGGPGDLRPSPQFVTLDVVDPLDLRLYIHHSELVH